MLNKFSAAFWGTDIGTSDGFDSVCQQLQNGRQLCKGMEDFLKQRSKMEEEYSKALIRLANSSAITIKSDDSSIQKSWDILRQQTEDMATAHTSLSRAFDEQANRLSILMTEQRRRRKMLEDDVRKLHILKKDAFKKVNEMRKVYHKRCKDADLQDKLTCGTSLPKEKEKMVAKQLKCRNIADCADKSFVDSVDSLSIIQSDWEKKMAEFLEESEELERNRIVALRNEMWEHANFTSVTCVADDKCCEIVRIILEKCVVEEDIAGFIRKYKTGSDRPDYVVYNSFYGEENSPFPPSNKAEGDYAVLSY